VVVMVMAEVSLNNYVGNANNSYNNGNNNKNHNNSNGLGHRL
jgi:hypothetical protein